jgi:hypothetical protein
MHIDVDDKGFTRVTDGKPNANVCLDSDADLFFHFYLPMVMHSGVSAGQGNDGIH